MFGYRGLGEFHLVDHVATKAGLFLEQQAHDLDACRMAERLGDRSRIVTSLVLVRRQVEIAFRLKESGLSFDHVRGRSEWSDIEVVTYRLLAQVPGSRHILEWLHEDTAGGDEVAVEDGSIMCQGERAACRFVWRASLPLGYVLEGCRVIEEPAATTATSGIAPMCQWNRSRSIVRSCASRATPCVEVRPARDAGGEGSACAGFTACWRTRCPSTAILTVSALHPWGLFGGRPGATTRFAVARDGQEIDLPSKVNYGDPREREPDRIERDLKSGLITPAPAHDEYGA